MGFFNPLLLLAGVAIAVPIVLHLFHRHDKRRVSFPAIRYLLRTEKEHARTIRFRQILLLVLRIAAILALVLAAARPFLRSGGGVHEPTALVIVLDNSMSSGLVEEDRRVLDRLKAVAIESLDRAGEEDRIWVIRAGEPWNVASPGGPEDVRSRILETEVSASGADILLQIERAEALLAANSLGSREIHVISDLQATGFGTDGPLSATVPILVFDGHAQDPTNRALRGLLIGGGLPPIVNQQTRISVSLTSASDTLPAPVRLVAGGRIRATGLGAHGTAVVLPFGPFPNGRVAGYVETDPDALRWDDRQFFVTEVAPAPAVATAGPLPFFLDQALAVLQDAGRVTRVPSSEASVLWSIGGSGLEGGRATPTVIVPPSDPALMPALNRVLSRRGIPWQYEVAGTGGGESSLRAPPGPLDLQEVRIFENYRITGVEDPGPGSVHLSSGELWLVAGQTSQGSYVLLGSPLDVESTNLPLTASMIPMVEWLSAQSTASDRRGAALTAGDPLPATAEPSIVQDPGGTRHSVDAGIRFLETRLAGLYEVLVDDSVTHVFAVNSPPRESDLRALDPDDLPSFIDAPDLRVISDSSLWGRSVFVIGQGPEMWKGLLVIAILFLVMESLVAATGAEATRGRSSQRRAKTNAPPKPAT